MYLDHFGLQELPFSITPDTAFYFPFARYQTVLNTLLMSVSEGDGFIKVTGEVGTGKSLLCRKFLASLGDDYVTAYLPNPCMEPRAILQALLEELGAGHPVSLDQHGLLSALSHRLIALAAAGKRIVVCLDEAQSMSLESLEAIRLMSNLETEKRKLLQVVLFGQPELDQKLALPGIRQLRQRIVFQEQLQPMSRDEMPLYLHSRLEKAGYGGGELFTHSALNRLYQASGGVPRLINLLAHKSMLLAYGKGEYLVDVQEVADAVQDTPAAHQSWWDVLRGTWPHLHWRQS
ncbi:AAA family ATPase [Burkholderiaceae bacterium DAT-1]|nr:AAA family ATPase [Burkholderiaceae bacterium DAT-1]